MLHGVPASHCSLSALTPPHGAAAPAAAGSSDSSVRFWSRARPGDPWRDSSLFGDVPKVDGGGSYAEGAQRMHKGDVRGSGTVPLLAYL